MNICTKAINWVTADPDRFVNVSLVSVSLALVVFYFKGWLA